MQLYLANELGYFRYKDGRDDAEDAEATAQHRYLAISAMIDELGRMIGGWIKKTKDEYKWQ